MMPGRVVLALMFLLGAALSGAMAGVATPAHADPMALWRIVHGGCVPDFRARGNPAPCAEVRIGGGERQGYAILKDRRGVAQFLLIPTARVTGIEDPALLAPGAPGYFADAWANIALVPDRLRTTLPREDLSLAVNAISGRTQNQLHIHMDCIRADVRDRLRQMAPGIGPSWAPLPEALGGIRYRAMRIDGATLTADPFRLLAAGVPGAVREMGRHTLVLVGESFADGRPGFILLDDRADLARGDPGNGERLQDHACAVARLG